MKNSEIQFGMVAIVLHWLMAILIIALLAVGLYMVNLPVGLEKLKFFRWHKEYGILVLALATIRLSWRMTNITPQLDIPFLEKLAARAVHFAFYILMFVMPLTGWMLSSASGLPVSFFGLFVLPDLVSPNEVLRKILVEVHELVGYAFILLIALHIAAALKHHFYDKDTILKRMLP